MPAIDDASQTPPSVQWPWPQIWPARPQTLRLGVMASGEGSNFEALVQACRQGVLGAEVAQLAVNNPGCGAERRASRLGVACACLDHREHASRESLDLALIQLFRAASVDMIVLAG